MKRVSILLVIAVLIAGMVGCESTPTPQHNLAIASTEGGSVTSPGEGMLAYDEATVVSLVATPNEGYRFVNWTGDVSTLADVEAATTNISMNGDYIIVANFGDIPPVQYDISII